MGGIFREKGSAFLLELILFALYGQNPYKSKNLPSLLSPIRNLLKCKMKV